MSKSIFEGLVIGAWDGLPDSFREKLDNVELVIEDWPNPQVLRLAGVSHPADLLGFYQGVPQTSRTHNYNLVLPDKISIFKRPIEMRCSTMDQAQELVRHVMLHEIAHHFGLDDGRLKNLGAY